MRIRRSWMRIVGALIAPVICAAPVLYFGYFRFWGARGLMALADAQRDLAVEREQLDAIRGDRERLQHRIELLQPGRADRERLRLRRLRRARVPPQPALPDH